MPEDASLFALCPSEQLANDGSKGFEVEGQSIFAVRKRGRVFVYQNRCPHAGLPLNWIPDQFLDLDRELIQCTSHGALFRIDNGQCVSGPCPGQYLRSIECREVNGKICIDRRQLAG